MCGIAGYISKQPDITINKMLGRLNHRGPDGEGVYIEEDKSLVLGHKRLSILDLENGTQPMRDVTDNLIITFNGEIFNHIELREELETLGYNFKTTGSDTEVILNSYLHWGEDFLSKLNGMFAFVLFDRRKNILLGARDRMGEKPLFYTHLNTGEFIFSSELPSLLEHPQVKNSISLFEVQRYFAWGYSPGCSTILENVYKLQSGHFFIFKLSDNSLQIYKYYEFLIEPDESFSNQERLLDEFDEILFNATRRRIQSDVPICAFLSGGIDSSLVLAQYTRVAGNSALDTYTIGFKEKSFDESSYAIKVARYFGYNNNLTILDINQAKKELRTILRNFSEPLGDASLLPSYLLSKHAAHKYKVVLSGDGADELFGGYDPLLAMKFAQFYKRLIPSSLHNKLQSLAELLPTSSSYMSFDFKVKRTLMGLSQDFTSMLPIWMSTLDYKEISELFIEPVRIDDLYSEAITHWESRHTISNLEKSLEFFTRFYLADNILVKSDRTSMLNSLENRSVYLDNEVVDFAARLPLQFKLKGLQRKYLLKKVASRYLPKSIINRKKKGFGIPFSDWAKNHIDFRSFELGIEHDTNFVNSLFEQHKSGVNDSRLFLWAWYSLQQSHLMQSNK